MVTIMFVCFFLSPVLYWARELVVLFVKSC